MKKTKLEGIRKDVFLDRYSLKDKNGKSVEEYPEEMWHRVSKGVAENEKTPKKQKLWEQKFYGILEDFKFVPGGRILTGEGSPHDVTFYNCFVLPSPKDSRKGILETLGIMTEIMAK